MRTLAERIVQETLQAADPARAVEAAWPADLGDGPITLIAYGKASVAMASAAIERLGDRIERGVVVGVPERVAGFQPGVAGIRVMPADHPLPTERNLAAAHAIEALAGQTPADGTVLVLISGGGSAQITAPAGRLTLEDIRLTTDAMLRAGATIDELNAVRKHCDRLKGGRLAAALAPARVVGLVVSDVMGDRLDVVSSGLTVPDPSTYTDAIAAIGRTGAGVADRVLEHLRAGERGEHPETPKPGDGVFDHVQHRVIANNAIAVDAARRALESAGYRVETRTGVVGEASAVGRELGQAVAGAEPGIAMVWGGETTVDVGSETGVGGRNQELALAAAAVLTGIDGAGVMSIGTDGVDGPTDAAGGFVTGNTASKLAEMGVDLAASLKRHDSFSALSAIGGLIRTGPTGTNVNDIMVGVRLPAR